MARSSRDIATRLKRPEFKEIKNIDEIVFDVTYRAAAYQQDLQTKRPEFYELPVVLHHVKKFRDSEDPEAKEVLERIENDGAYPPVYQTGLTAENIKQLNAFKNPEDPKLWKIIEDWLTHATMINNFKFVKSLILFIKQNKLDNAENVDYWLELYLSFCWKPNYEAATFLLDVFIENIHDALTYLYTLSYYDEHIAVKYLMEKFKEHLPALQFELKMILADMQRHNDFIPDQNNEFDFKILDMDQVFYYAVSEGNVSFAKEILNCKHHGKFLFLENVFDLSPCAEMTQFLHENFQIIDGQVKIKEKVFVLEVPVFHTDENDTPTFHL